MTRSSKSIHPRKKAVATRLRDAALEYAAAGHRVFPLFGASRKRCDCGDPICPDPGKHSLSDGWALSASSDETAIRAWWDRWPNANVAIVTGEPLVILEIHWDYPSSEKRKELEHKLARLPDTVSVTGGDGRLCRVYRSFCYDIPSSANRLAANVACWGISGRGGSMVLTSVCSHFQSSRHPQMNAIRGI